MEREGRALERDERAVADEALDELGDVVTEADPILVGVVEARLADLLLNDR